MKKGGFGLLGNIGIGSAGGVAGGFLFRLLDVVVGGLVGSLATTVVGAVIFLYVGEFLKNAWRSFNPSTEEM